MAKNASAAAAAGVTEEVKAPDTVVVTKDMSDETVLKLDSEGYFLRFSVEKGEWKEMSDEVVAQLSPMTRGAYSALKPLAKQEAAIDRSFAPGIEVVGPIDVAGGAAATQQIHGTKVKPGLAKYFSHPSKIAKRMMTGWRVATKDDIVESVAPRLNGASDDRRALKMGSGQVESVLMVKDADLDAKHRNERDEKRRALGEAREQATAEDVAKITKDRTTTPY